MADVATVAEENIVGVHVVKAFAQEGAEQNKFARRSEDVFGRSVEANRQRALYVPLLSFLPLIAQAAVLLLGGRMVTNGSLSFGQFVSFNIFVVMLVMPLRMLGMWIGQMQRATASGERIFEVIDEPEMITEKPDAIECPPGDGRVRFEGVSFEYAPGRRVLEDIDLELEPGRTVALIGHTGSGKTTLVSLVPRFYDATAGRVTVDGVDVRDLKIPRSGTRSRSSRRTRSCSRPPSSRTSRSASTAQRRKRSRTPPGWHRRTSSSPCSPTVTRPSSVSAESRSSGGQRQRLAIARALIMDPRILMLDDATASVDATTEAKIRLGLREAMKGRTTIIIAHRLSTISLADELVVLDGGRIVGRGTDEELLRTNAVFREIYEHGLLEREFADRVEARA